MPEDSSDMAEITIGPNGSLLVSGRLVFASAPALRNLGNQMLKNAPAEAIFDLQAVAYCDSSALSLLTAWARKAKNLRKTIRFINLPAGLLDIAQLSNLDKVLSLH
jgi:anti-anti-sigma factor